MQLKKTLLLTWAAACWVAALMHARAVSPLSYRELVNRSDLVVVATPATKTADTSEQYTPSIRATDGKGRNLEIKWTGVETRFAVAAVLKGDPGTKELVLHHYRQLSPSSGGMANGPMLVWFDPGTDSGLHSCYLLFLVREPDGRYAPTDGQTDPGMKAISKIPPDLGSR